jgi:hypothetical protein
LLGNSTGGPPQVLAPVVSPFIFMPVNAVGTLIVYGGQVEISRAGGAYILIGQTGGTIPMLVSDAIRVTWFGPSPPNVVFLPTL